MMLPQPNVWCSVLFSGRLHVLCYLQTFTGISSGFRANLNSTVSITLLQSDTVQFTCCRHLFNPAPLDWTDKRTQTCSSRVYRPFMCSLRRTVVVYIVLPLAAATVDVKRVEFDLRFCLATIALYRSLMGVVTRGGPATSLRTAVLQVWNCFHSCKVTERWTPKEKGTCVMNALLQCIRLPASSQNLPFVFWKS